MKFTAVLSGFLGFVIPLVAGPVPQCVQATVAQYIAQQSCLVGTVLYADFGANAFPPFNGVAPPFSLDDIIITPSVLPSATSLNYASPHFAESRTAGVDIQLSFRIQPQSAPPVIDGESDSVPPPPPEPGQDVIDINKCYGDSFAADGSCPATLLFFQVSDKGPGFPPEEVEFHSFPVYELGEIVTMHLGPSTGGGFSSFDTTLYLVPEPAAGPLAGASLALLVGMALARKKAGKVLFHFAPRS